MPGIPSEHTNNGMPLLSYRHSFLTSILTFLVPGMFWSLYVLTFWSERSTNQIFIIYTYIIETLSRGSQLTSGSAVLLCVFQNTINDINHGHNEAGSSVDGNTGCQPCGMLNLMVVDENIYSLSTLHNVVRLEYYWQICF